MALASIVDIALGLGGDPTGGIDHYQIGVSVPVEIGHESLDAAVSSQRDPAQGIDRLAVVQIDVGIFVFAVSVAVGDEEIDVAVLVEIQAIDELDPPSS